MTSISPPAIDVSHVTFRYGDRVALDDLSLVVQPGEIFAFLGPNGSGKTTLFRLLSTLIALQEGDASILGGNLRHDRQQVRGRIGVVFQAPSLDKKLTVAENLRHQGRLYGLAGGTLRDRIDQMLTQMGLADRASEFVERLSGGLKRRVELAKGMLHRPELLLLDEPTTGLDPGARRDLWQYVGQLRDADGVTVVVTTHLLEEAEGADRVAILHEGRLVALDTPQELRKTVAGDSITICTADPAGLASAIREKFSCDVIETPGELHLEMPDGPEWIPQLLGAFSASIDSVTLGKPTLEDVFMDRTGHRFWADGD